MYSTRKKIHDEQEAQALLAQFDGYNGTLRAFCAEMDVDGRSLRAWQRRLTPEVPPPELQLVQLPTQAFAMPPTYRLTIGDVTVELNEDFNPEALRRLLGVVRSC